MLKLIFGGADEANTARLKARPTGSTEDLQHVQDGEVGECTLRAVVDLCTLDDDYLGVSEALLTTFHLDTYLHVPAS